MLDLLQSIGLGGTYVLLVLLCLAGVVLSCIGISGTWLVVAATLVAAVVRGDAFPGWRTVIVFILLSGLVEAAEALSGAWGVRRKGGSRLAGVLAVVGGLGGMMLGALIPLPVIGSLLGMIVGSFGLVFLVERRRLTDGQAAGIAWGAVIARILVILLKVMVTLGMAIVLFGGMSR